MQLPLFFLTWFCDQGPRCGIGFSILTTLPEYLLQAGVLVLRPGYGCLRFQY
jgi:hypothetical protein